MSSVITAAGLSKRYLINHKKTGGEGYVALRDVIGDRVKGLASSARGWFANRPTRIAQTTEEYWALKDVCFEIRRGDVTGIIGRNGAGKSTLLKVLSRITEPTTGSVTLRGRIASLLEVGTGFHPELTGRENIFLNGAILGMTRSEISRKFDEIVSFAEVEKFLDTPVKRYSSGMYVRLAFAVAAHLEPEILIIDEVLAVGDAAFQKKCLGKISEVATGGRTVLFVSHNMAQVRALCNKAILLNAGKVEFDGTVAEAINTYIYEGGGECNSRSLGKFIRAVSCSQKDESNAVDFGDELELVISITGEFSHALGCNIYIRNADLTLVSLFSSQPHDGFDLSHSRDIELSFKIPDCRYAPGMYRIDVEITEPKIKSIEKVESALYFHVIPKFIGGSWAYAEQYGSYFPAHSWEQKTT